MAPEDAWPNCPLPLGHHAHVLLAHGGGGRLMQDLIAQVFRPAFANPILDQNHDAARLDAVSGPLAFSTDSYVVRPLFFPGGDIGTLAVFGTVNDLVMCGARPRWLSAAFILEEGFAMEDLRRVVGSMTAAAERAGVQLVAGDTKVVDRGKGDGLFVCTSGVGVLEHDVVIAPRQVQPGDVILLSGDVGRHGMAIMAQRESLGLETTIESDCAPLIDPVLDLLNAGVGVHCLRDLTRGGLASVLNEIARAGGVDIEIEETAVPLLEEVRGACELLGLDPLYVACEGRFVAFIANRDLPQALDVLHQHPVSRDAVLIGAVQTTGRGEVRIRSRLGVQRVLDWLSGEQLPRIC